MMSSDETTRRAADGAPSVAFRVLGTLDLRIGGAPVPLGSPKQRAALAALLLHTNELVSADTLAEVLWGPRRPRSAGPNLRGYLTELRHRLSPIPERRLVTRPRGYLLRVGSDELDATRFEALARAGRDLLRAGDPGGAVARLDEALALWRGRPLADLSPGPVLAPSVEALEDIHRAATTDRITARLALGEAARLVPELRELVAAHPLHERGWLLLMAALQLSGDPAGALDAYADARLRLVADLGIEPGHELRRLHAAVLDGDPAGVVEQCTGLPAPTRAARAEGPPRHLPPAIRLFGREAELRTLDRLLTPAAVIGLHGPAGVGTSALARTAALRAAPRFPDGQLHLDLLGTNPHHEPMAATEALARLLRALRAPGDPPADSEAALRAAVAGRRLLIVLDNAAHADQVRPLLPAADGCAVLVTSRAPLALPDPVTRVATAPLARRAATDMLVTLAGRTGCAAPEHAAAAEIALLCECLPLALRIVAARLAERPDRSLRGFADRLRDHRHRLVELSLEEADGDRLAMRLFGSLGRLGIPEVTPDLIAGLVDVRPEQAERALNRLVDVRMLSRPATGRYRLDGLVLQYAIVRGRAPEGAEARQPLAWTSASPASVR